MLSTNLPYGPKATVALFSWACKVVVKRLSPQQRQTNDSIHAKLSTLLVSPVYLLRRACGDHLGDEGCLRINVTEGP